MVINDCTLWTDPQCALHWIQSTKDWRVYVKNRTEEIDSRVDIRSDTQKEEAILLTQHQEDSQCNLLMAWLTEDKKKWPT